MANAIFFTIFFAMLLNGFISTCDTSAIFNFCDMVDFVLKIPIELRTEMNSEKEIRLGRTRSPKPHGPWGALPHTPYGELRR